MDDEFVERSVAERLVPKLDFPVADTPFDAFHRVAGALLPAVEVAHNVYLRCIRRPFAEDIAVFRLVQAEVEIAAGKLAEVVCAARQLCHLTHSLVVPPVDGIGKACQSAVVPDESEHGWLCCLGLCIRLGFLLGAFLRFLGNLSFRSRHHNNLLFSDLQFTI